MPQYWDNFLIERNTDTNSAAACIEILNYYLSTSNNSYKRAIKKYKGISHPKNHYLITRTIKTQQYIYKKLTK